MAKDFAFVRTSEAPKLPPPPSLVGWPAWLRENLFNGWLNSLLTVVFAYLAFMVIWTIADWAILSAVWSGTNREPCAAEGAGACWPFVKAKFPQWVYGLYPVDQRWRPNIVFLLGAVLLAGLLIPAVPFKKWNAVAFLVVYPVVTFVLLLGGWFGLEHVETTQWGGLLVTLVVSVTGIVASLPFGVLLALGRRSKMPVVKLLSVIYIEVIRGVPLITVLFIASVMLPLFFPPGMTFDKLLRALIGVAMFSAAYMAEVVRGGLQAIPKGQYEAASALGLSYWRVMVLIVLPQALKIVIPGIVNTFIGLFKDTTLVSIIGIFDLLGMAQAGIADANWATSQTGNTTYFGIALMFWVFCFLMSRYSIFVERRLNTGHKR